MLHLPSATNPKFKLFSGQTLPRWTKKILGEGNRTVPLANEFMGDLRTCLGFLNGWYQGNASPLVKICPYKPELVIGEEGIRFNPVPALMEKMGKARLKIQEKRGIPSQEDKICGHLGKTLHETKKNDPEIKELLRQARQRPLPPPEERLSEDDAKALLAPIFEEINDSIGLTVPNDLQNYISKLSMSISSAFTDAWDDEAQLSKIEQIRFNYPDDINTRGYGIIFDFTPSPAGLSSLSANITSSGDRINLDILFSGALQKFPKRITQNILRTARLSFAGLIGADPHAMHSSFLPSALPGPNNLKIYRSLQWSTDPASHQEYSTSCLKCLAAEQDAIKRINYYQMDASPK